MSLALGDREGPLFLELTTYLDTLPRLGVPIVLMRPKRKSQSAAQPPRPFKLRDARARVRKAATKAGLPADLTLAACRHGEHFAAVVARDAVAGAQFHPERSASVGARLLANFLRWTPA